MFEQIPLRQLLHDLTDERTVYVSDKEEVVEPTISTKTHTISIASVKQGKDVKVRKRIRVLKGDLVFSHLHTQNGAFAFANREFLCTSTFAPFSIDETKVDRNFLFWALHVRVPSLSALDTVGRETYKTEDILKLEIPYTSLDIQKKIVLILNKANDLKRKLMESILLVDKLTESIFIQMFGDPMINPKDWQIENLGKFLSFVTSGSRGWKRYYSESGSKFIRAQNIDNNKLDLTDIAYVNPPDNMESKRTRVHPRDVLITITGYYTGLAAVAPDDILNAHVSQHVAITRIKDSINPYYLASFITLPTGGKIQFSKVQYGQSKSGLNLDQIKSLKVVIPPMDIQDKFENIFHKIEKINDKLERSNTEFMYLYNVLLHEVFTEKLVN